MVGTRRDWSGSDGTVMELCETALTVLYTINVVVFRCSSQSSMSMVLSGLICNISDFSTFSVGILLRPTNQSRSPLSPLHHSHNTFTTSCILLNLLTASHLGIECYKGVMKFGAWIGTKWGSHSILKGQELSPIIQVSSFVESPHKSRLSWHQF